VKGLDVLLEQSHQTAAQLNVKPALLEPTIWRGSCVWNAILELFPKPDLQVKMIVPHVQLVILGTNTQEQLNVSNVLQASGKTREPTVSPALAEPILKLEARAEMIVSHVLLELLHLFGEEQANVPPVRQEPMRMVEPNVFLALLELPQRLEFQAVLGVSPAPQGRLPLNKGTLNA